MCFFLTKIAVGWLKPLVYFTPHKQGRSQDRVSVHLVFTAALRWGITRTANSHKKAVFFSEPPQKSGATKRNGTEGVKTKRHTEGGATKSRTGVALFL